MFQEPSLKKAALIFACAIGLAALAYAATTAHDIIVSVKDYESGDTIAVSGIGRVAVVPTFAKFDFTVDTEGFSEADAQTKSRQALEKITTFLKEKGVADSDIKITSSISYSGTPAETYDCYYAEDCVYPVTNSSAEHVVSQTVAVRLNGPEKMKEIVAGLIERGAGSINNLTYGNDDSDNVLSNEARTKAIQDAKQKRDMLANELGISLGKIIGFNDNTTPPTYSSVYYNEYYDGTTDGVVNSDAYLVTQVDIVYEVR